MSVDVRVGNYNLDSSNFITDEGFSGFLGSTGTVGIDRDYDSLAPGPLACHRSVLQSRRRKSFQEAGVHVAAGEGAQHSGFFARRRRSSTWNPCAIPIGPRATGSRKPRQFPPCCARSRSCTVPASPIILIYTTSYLLNTDGTKIRANRSLAAIEASLGTESDDGMPLHNFLAVYRHRPDELPAADTVAQ